MSRSSRASIGHQRMDAPDESEPARDLNLWASTPRSTDFWPLARNSQPRGAQEGVQAQITLRAERVGDIARRRGDGVGICGLGRGALRVDDGWDRSPLDSTVSAMRFIVATASRGYWPDALSADSMTASAPSNTAVATSETSARVGTGAVIIDSSIWVATTIGLPSLAPCGSCFSEGRERARAASRRRDRRAPPSPHRPP